MVTEPNMTGEQVGRRWIAWATEGFVLAIAPVIGYFVAFVFEVGYAGKFKIPIEFISLSLSDIIAVTSLLAIIAALIWIFFGGLYVQAFHKSTDPVYRRVFSNFPFFVLFVIHALLFRDLWSEYLWVVVYFVLFLFFDFVFPLIAKYKVTGYKAKLTAQDKIDDAARRGPLRSFIAREGGRPAQFIIVVGIFVLTTAHSAGRASALNKAEYLVPSDGDNIVVLRLYGDHLVCAPFDRDKKTVRPEFSILPLVDTSNQRSLNLEKVGPLRLEAEST